MTPPPPPPTPHPSPCLLDPSFHHPSPRTHTYTVLFGGDQKPSLEAPHLGMFAEEAGPGRAALHAPVDWLHQVWPAVLLAWPRAVGAVQLGKACFPKEEKKKPGTGGGEKTWRERGKKRALSYFELITHSSLSSPKASSFI